MSDVIEDATAERAVLGAMLTAPQAIDDVTAVLAGGDFYQPKHQRIYDAVVTVYRRRERPDVITVAKELGPDLQRVGGPAFLADLIAPETTPTPGQAPHYAKIVADKALGRRMVMAFVQGRERVEKADDMAAAVEDARQAVDAAASTIATAAAGVDAGDLLEETLAALENPEEPGISTGWSDLDRYVGGLRPGQLVVIGARPSVGKSVIAGNLAASACKSGFGVHFASLEMTRAEVMKRMISAEASVDLSRVMAHQLDEGDWGRVRGKYAALREWPLWVDDTEGLSVLQLRARARNTARRIPLRMVIVDYLQLMTPRDRRVAREQQVGEMSEGLKSLAKELGVPVVALAQVNRGPMDRQDKRPQLSDLRESGRIEADADHVWLLHRQDLVDPHSATGELEVIVAKNRNGPQGATVTLQFQGHCSRAVQRHPEPWTPTRGLSA